MVPSFGGTELLIILAIILLFFGAKRVPELGRSLGKSMREFRKASSEEEDDHAELRQLDERRKQSPEEEQARSVEAHAPVAHENDRSEQPAERKS